MREPKCPIANMVCPRNSDAAAGKYCPAWTEYVETNIQTGEERLKKECVLQALPRFLLEGIKASNRPAAAAESMRNEVARGFQELSQRVQRIPALLLENRHDDT
jgi:hypothetical protein